MASFKPIFIASCVFITSGRSAKRRLIIPSSFLLVLLSIRKLESNCFFYKFVSFTIHYGRISKKQSGLHHIAIFFV